MATQVYRDGFHWFEAVGVTKGKSDAAVDMIEIPSQYLARYPFGSLGFDDKSVQTDREEFQAQLRKLLS